MDEFIDFIALVQDENDLEIRRRVSFVLKVKLSDVIERGISRMPAESVVRARITKTIVGPN